MEDVFYPGPFSFRMGLGRSEPGEFFRARAGDETLIAERKEILANHPERHCVLLPEGEPANILSITPPLTVGKTHIARFTRALGQTLEDAYA